MKWTKVLYEYCSHLSIREGRHFENYMYFLHCLYKDHLSALWNTMKLFPKRRTYNLYVKKSIIYTPKFDTTLDMIRDEGIKITNDFF